MENHCTFYFLLAGTLCFLFVVTDGQKPYPTYSLDNMPKTKFSCRDKILGGYYADPETQCQMFHVCVKVAGVGIQDYRFLCPNGTAFNQEAQVCADYGDVNCEQDTLYYGSGNFDLYRIGTGFESKRTPLEDEEESEFQLQRAETSDARRSKQYIVNQGTRSEKPVLQNTHGIANNRNNIVVSAKPYQTTSAPPPRTEAPIVPSTYRASPSNYYSQTTTTAASILNTNNDYYNAQRRNNNHDYYNNNNDDIFKGSHSGNFFTNRNGRDDSDDFSRSQPSTTTTTTTTSTTTRPPQPSRPRSRSRGHIKARVTAEPYLLSTFNDLNQEPSTTRPPIPPKPRPNPKKISQAAVTVNNRGGSFSDFDNNKFNNRNGKAAIEQKSTHLFLSSTPDYQKYSNGFSVNSVAPDKQSFNANAQSTTPYPTFNSIFNTTLPASSPAPFQKVSEFSFNSLPPNYSTQYQTTTTTTFKPPTPFQVNNLNEQNRFYSTNVETTGTSVTPPHPTFQSRRSQNNLASKTHLNAETPSKEIKPSTYNPGTFQRFTSPVPTTINEFISTSTEFTPRRFNPQNFEPAKLNGAQQSQVNNRGNNFETQQQYNARQLQLAQIHLTTSSPQLPPSTPVAQINNRREGSRYTPDHSAAVTTIRPNEDKYQTISRSQPQRSQQETFQTPSTAKKFSTLVPKDNFYSPTTFKPDIFNKKKSHTAVPVPVPNQTNLNVQTPFRINPSYDEQNVYQPQPTRVTTTTTSTTLKPLEEGDEDDGQYRPELYEKDLYKNKLKAKLARKHHHQDRHYNYYQTTTTTYKPNVAEEDELFNTAHSQNIAASGNELRAERARQVATQVNKLLEKANDKQSVSTTKTPLTETKQQKDDEKDVSYDYQYYDFGNDHHVYDELIEEFSKTKLKSKN